MANRDEQADDASAARDFVMARMAAARVSAQTAIDGLDSAMALFVDPHDDASGKERKDALELVDGMLGDAASSVQQAMAEFRNVDPQEGEPDDDEEEPAPEPPPPTRRRRR